MSATKIFRVDRHLYWLYRLSYLSNISSLPFTGFISVVLRQFIRVWASCDISPIAEISRNCEFPHPLGIVIGDQAIVAENVMIWHGVTLGSHGKSGDEPSYPQINEGAKIFANSTILGGVTIGKNSVVGACSLVLTDVPDGATAIGVPARILTPSEAE